MNLRLLAGGGMAVCAIAACAHKPATLSLDDCLAIALGDNPSVKVADMEVERMDYSRKEVIGNLLPNIDFSGSYSRTLEKQVMYMNMDGFGDFGGVPGSGEDAADAASRAASRASGGNDGGIKVGLDNSYSMGFSASLPIIAPQLWKSISLSDTQIARSLEAARQSRQALVSQVKSAYYTLLLALDSRQVIQQSYDMAALTYDTYSKQYAAGAASDYDVLRTSVAMKNIEPQLMQADIAIKQARLQLLLLMGIDSTIDFDVADRLSDYEKTMYADALALSDPDYSGNADMRLLDLDKKILEKNLTVQKLAFAPTLALAANYNWTSISNGSPFLNFLLTR
ncbi:MAG: TolC family protein, partial [Muribaculaceae bacterium]|nr:TolC family protein [Muribaculaceae bacterium]